MWRGAVVAAVFYAYGHPVFDDYRPAALDRPFRALHVSVNQAAREGQRTIAVGGPRVVKFLGGYVERVETQLKSAN
jgi:hypothetical protein